VITGTLFPPAEASGIIARRKRTVLVLPRRTIRCSLCLLLGQPANPRTLNTWSLGHVSPEEVMPGGKPLHQAPSARQPFHQAAGRTESEVFAPPGAIPGNRPAGSRVPLPQRKQTACSSAAP
jgi:hypothetical protein